MPRLRTPALLATLLLALAAACGTVSSRDWAVVEATIWRLEEIDGEPTLEGVDILLRLEAGHRIFGNGGVNEYFGSYGREGDRFATSRLATTRMAGPPDVRIQEDLYLALLDRVDRIRVGDAWLQLLEGETVLLRFVPLR